MESNQQLARPNSQQTLIEYCNSVKSAEFKDVINSQAGSLQLIKSQLGDESVEFMVIYYLTDLNDFFNFNKKMTSSQIAETSSIIISKYPFWTPEDFARCYQNIKLLKYGPLYESIDGSKVLNFMDKYEQDFVEEKKSHTKHQVENKREEFENEFKKTSELILPVLKKVVEDMDKKKVEVKIKPREKTDSEKIVDGWYAEFDRLYEEQEVLRETEQSIRTVVYPVKGAKKILSQSEFIGIKFDEYTERNK